MSKDNKYYSKERADAAKRSNARHANMARAYASRPTLPNMIKAAYNYYLSKPALGGEDESGLELNKGIAPTPGRGRGFRPQNVRDAANKAKQTYNQMSSAARRTYGRQTQVNDKIPYNQNNMFRGFTLGKGNSPKTNPYAGATSSKQSFEYQYPKDGKGELDFDDDVSFWTRLNRNKLHAAAGVAIAAGGLKAGDWYILNNVVGKNNNSTSTNNTTNVKNNNTSTNRPTNVESTNTVRTDSITTDSTRTYRPDSIRTQSTNNRNQVVVNRDSTVTNRDSTTNNRTQTTVNNTTTASKSNSTKSSTNSNKSNNSNKERKHLEEVPGVYDIKKGDNLWNIAKRYTGKGSNYKELLKLNPNIKNEDLIYAGDKLRIPESWLKK